ncbi:hypothetical protein [Streptomyces sp. NPDC021020]|uniref:hypothetical protein n=1 Tax=Streptomyces sp. NPDC021020 TaxID=3365109 RepID=UPI0037A1D459
MDEPRNIGLAAAIASGYVLGRTKRGQVALTAAALLAGRGLRPGSALAGAVRKVPGIPGAPGGTDEDEAEGDGKKPRRGGPLGRAVRGVADRGASALGDTLRERTAALAGLDEPPAEEDTAEEEDKGGEDEDDEPTGGGGDSRKKDTRSASPTRGSSRPAKKAAQSTRSTARKKAPAGKPSGTAARGGKQTGGAKAPGKAAGKTARKTAPKAGKAAGTAKKAQPRAASGSRTQRDR